MVLVPVGGGGGDTPTPASSSPYDIGAGLAFLQAQLGKPYKWAASGPKSYDCSGLSMRFLQHAGYKIAIHNAAAQYTATIGTRLKKTSSPPAGALCFYGSAGIPVHVGVSIGGGNMIEAPHTGENVKVQSIAAERKGFGWYAATNPLGASEQGGLTIAEEAAADQAAPKQGAPALLGLYLAATRWQESGSIKGNYKEPNGQGAYQIIPSTWAAATAKYGIGTQYKTASAAPATIQDQIAAAKITDIYYGAGDKSWRLVARIWNGGSPNPVPNPALGDGATTDTYASQVLKKMGEINPAELGGVGVDAAALGAAGGVAAGAAADPGCAHNVAINLKIATTNICLDKTIAIAAMSGGVLVMFAGLAVVMVTALHQTPAGKAAMDSAAIAFPAGKALKLAGAAKATNAKKATARTAAQTKATNNTTAQARAARAETRREEAHRVRVANAQNTDKRRDEAHLARQSRADSAAARGVSRRSRPSGMSRYPAHGDPEATPVRKPTPRAPLPDKAPF